jgi:hypothetical protein
MDIFVKKADKLADDSKYDSPLDFHHFEAESAVLAAASTVVVAGAPIALASKKKQTLENADPVRPASLCFVSSR